MYVELGNDHPIEGYREGDDPEVKYRPLDGQQVTTLLFPDGVKLQEAFATTVAATARHFDNDPDTTDIFPPAWIESDSAGLQSLLQEHFGVTKSRPKTWGSK